MRRTIGVAMLGTAAVLLASTPAAAQQPWIFFGGGPTIPVGEFGDYAKTGWLATAGIGVDVGTQGLWVAAELHYGSNSHDDITNDKTNIFAGFGTIGYTFGPGQKVRPYVLGGLGFLSHIYKAGGLDYSETETRIGYTAAGGLTFQLSERVGFWVEGRFMGAADTRMIPILAGFTINFGN
jgi:opacity protein-like surface antigen